MSDDDGRYRREDTESWELSGFPVLIRNALHMFVWGEWLLCENRVEMQLAILYAMRQTPKWTERRYRFTRQLMGLTERVALQAGYAKDLEGLQKMTSKVILGLRTLREQSKEDVLFTVELND